jgi:hypothetical protein
MRMLFLFATAFISPAFSSGATQYWRLEAQIHAEDDSVFVVMVWQRPRRVTHGRHGHRGDPEFYLGVYVCGPAPSSRSAPPVTPSDRCWLVLPGLVADEKGRASRSDMSPMTDTRRLPRLRIRHAHCCRALRFMLLRGAQ